REPGESCIARCSRIDRPPLAVEGLVPGLVAARHELAYAAVCQSWIILHFEDDRPGPFSHVIREHDINAGQVLHPVCEYRRSDNAESAVATIFDSGKTGRRPGAAVRRAAGEQILVVLVGVRILIGTAGDHALIVVVTDTSVRSGVFTGTD